MARKVHLAVGVIAAILGFAGVTAFAAVDDPVILCDALGQCRFAPGAVALADGQVVRAKTINGALSLVVEPTIRAGADASKPGTCDADAGLNAYLATDTQTLYVCPVDNTWTAVGTSVPGSATLPTDCVVGEFYHDTDNIVGASLYYCVTGDGPGGSTDIWRSVDTPFPTNEVPASKLELAFNIPSGGLWNFGSAQLRVPQVSAVPTVDGQIIVDGTGLEWGDGSGSHTAMDLESAQTATGTKTINDLRVPNTDPTTDVGRISFNDTGDYLEVGATGDSVKIYPNHRQFFVANTTIAGTITTARKYAALGHSQFGFWTTEFSTFVAPAAMDCVAMTVSLSAALTAQTVVATLRTGSAGTLSDSALACTIDSASLNGANCNFGTGSGDPLDGTQCCRDTGTISVAQYDQVTIAIACTTGTCPTASMLYGVAVECEIYP